MYLYLKKLECAMIFTVSIYPYIIFIVKSLPNKTLRRKLVGRKTRIYEYSTSPFNKPYFQFNSIQYNLLRINKFAP